MPDRQLVVVAPTKEAGEARYPGAVVVTPRSPHAARGMTGNPRIIVMSSMRDHDQLDEILDELRPISPSVAAQLDLARAPRQTAVVQQLAKLADVDDSGDQPDTPASAQ